MNARVIRVKDLPDQLGTGANRAFLYCPVCHGEYSAYRGDYFAGDPDTIMRCSAGHHAEPLRLVQRHTQLVEVRP